MVSEHDDEPQAERELEQLVAGKQDRKLRARRQQDQSIAFGLGMFGLVGWSVTVPALVGIAIGVWIDSRWPSRFSWTVMLLVAGVAMGCLNAWRWVSRESQESSE